jgi:hydrogenase maturation protease
VLLLGLGSPHGEDAIGWRVVEQYQQQFSDPRVEMIILDRPGNRLLDYLQHDGYVLLVDAASLPDTSQPFRFYTASQVMGHGSLLSGHDLGIRESLALANAMGQCVADVEVLAINIAAQQAPSMETLVSQIRQRIHATLAP